MKRQYLAKIICAVLIVALLGLFHFTNVQTRVADFEPYTEDMFYLIDGISPEANIIIAIDYIDIDNLDLFKLMYTEIIDFLLSKKCNSFFVMREKEYEAIMSGVYPDIIDRNNDSSGSYVNFGYTYDYEEILKHGFQNVSEIDYVISFGKDSPGYVDWMSAWYSKSLVKYIITVQTKEPSKNYVKHWEMYSIAGCFGRSGYNQFLQLREKRVVY